MAKDTFAVIMTGGKQYKVAEGDTIKIEKLSGDHKEGDTITFDEVYLLDDGTKTTVGTPKVSAKVTGTLTEIGRNKKVDVAKYKAKSRYFIRKGHRQQFFKVAIDSIK